MKIGICKGDKDYEIVASHGIFLAQSDEECFQVQIEDNKVYYEDNVILFDDVVQDHEVQELKEKYKDSWVHIFKQDNGTHEVTVFAMEDGTPKVVNVFLGDLVVCH